MLTRVDEDSESFSICLTRVTRPSAGATTRLGSDGDRLFGSRKKNAMNAAITPNTIATGHQPRTIRTIVSATGTMIYGIPSRAIVNLILSVASNPVHQLILILQERGRVSPRPLLPNCSPGKTFPVLLMTDAFAFLVLRHD